MKRKVSDKAKSPRTPRETKWYVFLHDNPNANEIVDRYIGGHGCEDRLRRNVLCDDDHERDLWCTTYQEGTAIKKAGVVFGFTVTRFSAEGGSKPRKYIDPNIARHRRVLRSKIRNIED